MLGPGVMAGIRLREAWAAFPVVDRCSVASSCFIT
jgi:hypothetical protein